MGDQARQRGSRAGRMVVRRSREDRSRRQSSQGRRAAGHTGGDFRAGCQRGGEAMTPSPSDDEIEEYSIGAGLVISLLAQVHDHKSAVVILAHAAETARLAVERKSAWASRRAEVLEAVERAKE